MAISCKKKAEHHNTSRLAAVAPDLVGPVAVEERWVKQSAGGTPGVVGRTGIAAVVAAAVLRVSHNAAGGRAHDCGKDDRSMSVAVAEDGRSVAVAVAEDCRSVLVAVADDGRSVAVAVAEDGRSVSVAMADDGRSVSVAVADDGRSVSVAVAEDGRSVAVAVAVL